MLTFIDFFAGIGGFRLGMEQAGHKCLGHCEIDKFANISYNAIHQPGEGEWHAADIRGVEPEDLPEADCYCFGFPCQSFSIAGKRGGFEDTRGTLFFEVMRLAKERKPEILFAENVKGLLNHNGGGTFQTIINTIGELGYKWEYQVLNSKNFGVPQNRERVFIVGHLRGTGGGKVFPIIGGNGETVKQIIGSEQNSSRVYDPAGLSVTLTSGGGGQGAKTGLYVINTKQQGKPQVCEGISHCIIGTCYKEPPVVYQKTHGSTTTVHYDETGTLQAARLDKIPFVEVRPRLTPDRAEKRQNGRRFKEPGEEMFTLTAQDIHGVFIRNTEDGFHLARNDKKKSSIQGTHVTYPDGKSYCLGAAHIPMTATENYRIRKLTPRECFRLQGFPDWAFNRAKAAGVSDSQLYKQAGNSVTVNVVCEIAKRLDASK